MNLKKYARIDRRHISPYPVYLVTPPYSIFSRKYLKLKFNTFIMLFNDGMWNAILDFENYNESKRRMFKLYQKDKKIIDKFTKKLDKTSKKFLKFSKTFIKKDYKKLSNKDLVNLFRKYNKDYVNSYIYGEPPAQLLKDYLGEILKSRLFKIIKDEKKVNNIFTLLITPTKDNFIKQEEKDLLKISLIKNKIKQKKQLKKHYEKYNWIQVDYNSPALTLKYFENALKKIKPKKQENIKKQQLEIKKQYKIDNKTFNMCIAAQKAMYLMELKRARFSEAHYHIQFLMKGIGKRLDISLKQVNYLTPKEVIEHLLENKKANKKTLDNRYKKSVYISEEKRLILANKKLEAKIRSIFDKKIKTSRLKGTCGNPGKVKGKVRIIVKAKDFPKFKKGEILVTAFTTPDFVVIMKKAKAIITDYGGITSHAAIVSRELNLPCIVGTKHATTSLKDGDLVEIDADEGVVKKI